MKSRDIRAIVSVLVLMLRPYASRSTSSTPPVSRRRPTRHACVLVVVVVANNVSHVWIHLDSPLLAGKEAERHWRREKAAATATAFALTKRSESVVNLQKSSIVGSR